MATSGDVSQFGITKEEKDKLVAEVIRYVLFKTHQSAGCPIKREELTQIVSKHYGQRGLPGHVINEAKDKLSSLFGYELRELQRTHAASTRQGHGPLSQSGTDSKSYVIMSQLPTEVYRNYVQDVDSAHITGFTFVVLSVVYLAGEKIPEDVLWHHLGRMGLRQNDTNDPVLGNTKQALETLVQQRYLQKEKVHGPDGTTTFYAVAERALDEHVSSRIKDYISQVVKKNAASSGDND